MSLEVTVLSLPPPNALNQHLIHFDGFSTVRLGNLLILTALPQQLLNFT